MREATYEDGNRDHNLANVDRNVASERLGMWSIILQSLS